MTTLNNQLPELTISLHERVEAYIKDLQAQIQQMHFEKEELQVRAPTSPSVVAQLCFQICHLLSLVLSLVW